MVDAATIANTELNQDNVLRLVPSIVGGSETFTVQITDASGHSVCEMTKEEIASSAKEANNWVFVDGQMVAASAIADTDLSQATEIRMARPLVGGSEIDFSTDRFKTNGQVGWAMSELVDYKCALCGTIESFDRERNGIHCSHCGVRSS